MDVCSTKTAQVVFLTMVVVSVGLACWVTFLPLRALVGSVPDDAFYYLQIARNLAAGRGPTLDGETTTNGFHPGWMVIVTGLARLTHDRVALLRAALATAFALNLGTALVLVALFRRWFSVSWGWLVGAAWLANPLPHQLAADAVEASLYSLAIAVAVLVFARHVHPPASAGTWSRRSVGRLALFGALLGLVVLCRTEGVLLVACAVPVLFLLPASRPGYTWRLLFGLGRVGVVLVTMALVLAPAALYSLNRFGTVSQDSGAMKMLWRTLGPRDVLGGLQGMARLSLVEGGRLSLGPLPWLAMAAVGFTTLHPRDSRAGNGSEPRRGWPYALLALGVAGAVVSVSGLRLPGAIDVRALLYEVVTPIALIAGLARGAFRSKPWAPAAAWLLGATVLHVAVYGALIADWQFWYLGLPGLALFIAAMAATVASAGPSLGRIAGAHWAPSLFTGALLATALLRVPVEYAAGTYIWQRDVYTSQVAIDRMLNSQDRIGCFNAGIPAYFSDRFVTNLDGLVNHQIRPYYQARTVDEYVRANRITVICDEAGAMNRASRFMSRHLETEVIAAYPLTAWPTGPRYVWRVR